MLQGFRKTLGLAIKQLKSAHQTFEGRMGVKAFEDDLHTAHGDLRTALVRIEDSGKVMISALTNLEDIVDFKLHELGTRENGN